MAVQFKNPGKLPYYSPKVLAQGSSISIAKSVVTNFIVPSYLTEEEISKSYLGTPVLDNLEFQQGAYINLQGETIEYPNLIIDTVIFEVNRTKRVIETEIQGRDNSIFEYIGNSNYEITCNGIISNRDNVIPLEDARNLQKIFDVPQQIAVVSQFLNEVFEIFYIVIKSHSNLQVAGKRNEIPFSFVASQDVSLDVNELET